MSTTTPKRWYPNLKGIANPKSAFEVQTAEAVHQLTDYIYNVNDRIPAPAAPAKAGPAKTPNWWEQSYVADAFNVVTTSSAITVSWSHYKVSPTLFVNRKSPYLQAPDGSVTASGLTNNAFYWAYPAFDRVQNKVTFVVDPALAVPNTVFHTSPSAVAMMKAATGNNVPLDRDGMRIQVSNQTFPNIGGGLMYVPGSR